MEEGVDAPLAEAEDGSVSASGDGGGRFHRSLRRVQAVLCGVEPMQIPNGEVIHMPRGDGTGPPWGSGPGTGRGFGRGAGRGAGRMGGTRPGAGPAGKCVCPSCGNTIAH